jgi:hypothetical protein
MRPILGICNIVVAVACFFNVAILALHGDGALQFNGTQGVIWFGSMGFLLVSSAIELLTKPKDKPPVSPSTEGGAG